jgi:hypothetical protein
MMLQTWSAKEEMFRPQFINLPRGGCAIKKKERVSDYA